MRRSSVSVILASTILAWSSAQATDLELYIKLGNVLGSEAFCGLAYDQDAIKSFIERRISPYDMDFVGDLDARVENVQNEIQGMSASLKTAHCTMVTRTAKAYGFTK